MLIESRKEKCVTFLKKDPKEQHHKQSECTHARNAAAAAGGGGGAGLTCTRLLRLPENKKAAYFNRN